MGAQHSGGQTPLDPVLFLLNRFCRRVQLSDEQAQRAQADYELAAEDGELDDEQRKNRYIEPISSHPRPLKGSGVLTRVGGCGINRASLRRSPPGLPRPNLDLVHGASFGGGPAPSSPDVGDSSASEPLARSGLTAVALAGAGGRRVPLPAEGGQRNSCTCAQC